MQLPAATQAIPETAEAGFQCNWYAQFLVNETMRVINECVK
jgi:hypothetical protein